jgi:hypothetical protein
MNKNILVLVLPSKTSDVSIGQHGLLYNCRMYPEN